MMSLARNLRKSHDSLRPDYLESSVILVCSAFVNLDLKFINQLHLYLNLT